MPSNVDVLKSLMPDEVDLVEVVNSDVPVGPFGGAPTDLVAPDVEVRFIGPYETTPSEGVAYEGTEGLAAGWREWLLPYHSYRISPEEFLDAGEQVVMHARVSARTERDGVAIVHRPSSVWTFEHDRIVSVRFFLERDAALRFAGLDREQVSGEQ